MTCSTLYFRLNEQFARAGTRLQDLVLLLLRGWWGWSFFLTGKGKLLHLPQTTEFFASLHLPLPALNAIVAGSTECVGGLLLLFGLASRVASVPLIVTMLTAYVTAHREELAGIFSDPDAFTGAAPFLFLVASVVVLVFGPGRYSVDAVLARRAARR